MQVLDCGGKRSATPLWDVVGAQIAVSPLRFATALQNFDTQIKFLSVRIRVHPWLNFFA